MHYTNTTVLRLPTVFNTAVHVCSLEAVGEKNLSPQNMSLWHKDYFRMVNFNKQQTWEKL